MKKAHFFYCLTILINATGLAILLSACDTNKGKDTKEDNAAEQAPLVAYEILPYEISEERTVTMIKTDVRNVYEDSAFILVVKVDKGENVFMDSVSFAVRKGDSATGSFVFTQLDFETNNPPKVELIYK